MVRILSERDIKLLTVMAPEFSGESCKGSGVPYRSLLPPVANHYSTDANDFGARILRLSDEDFRYLIEMMISGEESLHCLPPDFFSLLERRIQETEGADVARKITARYIMECDLD
ncbi:MAG TPA: hypothetical protein VN372_15625 [Methanospirillum sp.]|nr:hypothetical protein [Methanospirillum sp.]